MLVSYLQKRGLGAVMFNLNGYSAPDPEYPVAVWLKEDFSNDDSLRVMSLQGLDTTTAVDKIHRLIDWIALSAKEAEKELVITDSSKLSMDALIQTMKDDITVIAEEWRFADFGYRLNLYGDTDCGFLTCLRTYNDPDTNVMGVRFFIVISIDSTFDELKAFNDDLLKAGGETYNINALKGG